MYVGCFEGFLLPVELAFQVQVAGCPIGVNGLPGKGWGDIVVCSLDIQYQFRVGVGKLF